LTACGFDISGVVEISELTERTSYEKTGRREQGDFFSSNDSQNTEYGKILFQYVNPDFKARLHPEILLAAVKPYAGR